MFSWSALKTPIFALSPMADLTDLPFSLMCKKFGADIIFREMVSSQAVVRGNVKTLRMTDVRDEERPLIQQIFGSDPDVMAKAAQIIYETSRPDGIDLNMGCPVYKITSNFDGASLMKDPERAMAIVRAVKSAVPVPVSVKTRLGWKHDTDCLDFIPRLAEAGADLISLHGRTKEQGYAGKANWTRVGEARALVPHLPFLLNGDVTDLASCTQALEASQASGVLIGRGALGRPWIFQELKQRENVALTIQERVAIVREHATLQVEHYGEHGLIKLRKHLPWYFKGLPEWKSIRAALVRISTLEELNRILDQLL